MIWVICSREGVAKMERNTKATKSTLTIGEKIDEENERNDMMVLSAIVRRKQEKLSCTLQGISSSLNLDEDTVSKSLSRLEVTGKISSRKYGQNITYGISSSHTENTDYTTLQSENDISTDFCALKISKDSSQIALQN